MASIVLSSVGSSIGNAILPGVGGRILGTAGRRLGAGIDEDIGWSEGSSARDGARLENFKVQDSRYGLSIPLAFGRARVAGNVIWASPLIETAHQESSGGKGGGMAGLSGSSRTTYSYSMHVAIALGEGPIGGVRTIWADSKVIYQDGVWKTGVVGGASFYLGSDDQGVDPLMESLIGSGMVPAYRGVAYVVLESLQLSSFGNRLPNLTFEIVPEKSETPPQLIGSYDPSMWAAGTAVRNFGMKPIVSEAGTLEARTVLLGGYDGDGAVARLVVSEVDISGDAAQESARRVSSDFPATSPGSQSWAMAADGRYVACGLQDGGTGKFLYLALYDVQGKSFGPVQGFAMGGGEDKQIAWLDDMRFAVTDRSGDRRGLRVFMRAGTGIVDLGFYDVWGAGSVATRYPPGMAHLLGHEGGLLYLAGNASPKFTALYACYVSWQAGRLVAQAPYTISNAVDLGTGSGPQFDVLQTGDHEWTALYMTALDVRAMSFLGGVAGAQIVRPWQALTHNPYESAAAQAAFAIGGGVMIVRRPAAAACFDLAEIVLRDNDFALSGAASTMLGSFNAPTDVCAINAGGGRFFAFGHAWDGRIYAAALAEYDVARCGLDEIMSRLLLRAGYEAQDFDVSALAGVTLDGMVLSDSDTLAQAAGWLMDYEPFDLIERDGKLVAVRRGSAAAQAIAAETLASRAKKESYVPPVEATRLRELALPVEVTLDTLDASRDYEIGTQRARRLMARGGARRMKLALPVVCGASRAKKVAERALYSIWGERVRYRFALPYSFAALDVGDVVLLDGARVRLSKMQRRGGVIHCEGVSARADGIASEALAEGGEALAAALDREAASRLYLMDLPALRSAEDGPGFYVAVSGGQAWKGASLWRSADGINFTQKASFELAATAGSVVQVPGNKSSYYKDVESVLKVQLYRGSLASCTEGQLLNGANVALCGGEIVQFETASLVGPMLYELRGLLRGRMGSESGIASHSVGEDFVLLTKEAVQFLPCALEDRGRLYAYRAVSAGGSLNYAQDVTMAAQLRSLRPLAPAHLRAQRTAGAGSDMLIGWVRRARVNGGWNDYVDVPLDEAQELYDVEIVKDGVVVRGFADVAAPQVAYSAAMQSADFAGVAQAQILVRVYQKSLRYGRGEMAEEVV